MITTYCNVKLLIVNANDSNSLSITLMADSTLMRSGMPFFVPDFAPHYSITPMLAMRVGRLGKCISKRFAHRYIDAVTAAMVVTPLDSELKPLGADDMMHAFDGASMMGTWSDFNPLEFAYDLTWTYNGEQHTLGASDFVATYEQAIEHISKYATIKMGDIICLRPSTLGTQVVAINDHFEASLGGTTLLKSKIK